MNEIIRSPQILYSGGSIDELAKSIAAILVEVAKPAATVPEVELITRDEVCKLLNFNKTTLHKHTVAGRLKSYGIGNRVLYKRSEVLAALTPLRK